jgi:hypothetical protein
MPLPENVVLSKSIQNLNKTLNKQFNDPRHCRTGSSFNREKRFSNDQRYFCKLSGQSISVGPGTYQALKLKSPCLSLIKDSAYLTKEEAKKQEYVMVGQQIKYDPAWIKRIPEYPKQIPFGQLKARPPGYYDPPSRSKKKLLKDLAVDDNLKSVSQAINMDEDGILIERLRHIKKARM